MEIKRVLTERLTKHGSSISNFLTFANKETIQLETTQTQDMRFPEV